MIERVIKNVLELPGVDGACIFDKKGGLLLNYLPDFFLDEFLDDLSRRVTALYEAVDENYMPCDDYLLKYPQKSILLRRSRHIFLLVAVDPSVNLVSLRMVTNLVLKHTTPRVLGELRASMAATIEEPVAPEPAPPAPTPPASTAPPAENTGKPQRALRPRMKRSFRGSSY